VAYSNSGKFLRAFKFSVLGWECVFQHGHYGDANFVVAENVKGDPGGVTKWGIDQRDHPSVDVRALGLEQAQDIFHDGTRDLHGHLEGGEWTRICGEELEDDWSLALFDCAVNPGLVSVHWAQEILGLRSDGKVGPLTIAAINAAGDKELRTLLAKRDLYYESRGAWANDFKEGWHDRNAALKAEIGLAKDPK
jgi:lysozyme family protein